MALNAAPIANYDSAEAEIKDLNAQAKLQGFAIIIKRSKKDKQTPPTVCNYGLYATEENTIYQIRSHCTAFKKTDCPFKATLSYTEVGWVYET